MYESAKATRACKNPYYKNALIPRKPPINPDSAQMLAHLDNAMNLPLPEKVMSIFEADRAAFPGSATLRPKSNSNNINHKVFLLTLYMGPTATHIAFDVNMATRTLVRGSERKLNISSKGKIVPNKKISPLELTAFHEALSKTISHHF